MRELVLPAIALIVALGSMYYTLRRLRKLHAENVAEWEAMLRSSDTPTSKREADNGK